MLLNAKTKRLSRLLYSHGHDKPRRIPKTSYDDTKSLLEDCGDLSGKTLIQLTTASAPETREMETWTIQNGGSYLDGAIMGFPSDEGWNAPNLLVQL